MINPYESPSEPPEPAGVSPRSSASGTINAAVGWTLLLLFAVPLRLFDGRPTEGDYFFGSSSWFKIGTTPITAIVAVALLSAIHGKWRAVAILDAVVLVVLEMIAWYRL